MLIYGVGLLLVLLSCCGLAIDLGNFEIARLKMQNAADAAAVGEALAYADGGGTGGGASDATLNGFTNGTNGVTVTITSPPSTGAYAGSAYAVQATITQTVTGTFIRKSFKLTAQATAAGVKTPCAYMMSQSSAQTTLTSVNQTFNSTCPFYMGRSYNLGGSSASTNSQFFVAGSGSLSAGSVSPAPAFGSPTIGDPLAYLAQPTFGSGCDQVNYNATAAATLNPGVYCGGLTINTSATVKLNPGMYIVLGALNINHPTLTGTGVTFFVSQGNGYAYAPSSIQNVNATLSAPTSGTWQGILYFSDRTLPQDQAALTMTYWNPSTHVDGIFYMANQPLMANSVTLKPNAYLGVVCDYMSINNSTFTPQATYTSLAGGSPYHPLGSGSAGLVE